MTDSQYLKPKAGQYGARGIVKKQDGMFQNSPPYPEFAGFYNKSCINGDNEKINVEKSPSSKGGKPI
jgi:hypothetical protein